MLVDQNQMSNCLFYSFRSTYTALDAVQQRMDSCSGKEGNKKRCRAINSICVGSHPSRSLSSREALEDLSLLPKASNPSPAAHKDQALELMNGSSFLFTSPLMC